jgi:hypothetical protein
MRSTVAGSVGVALAAAALAGVAVVSRQRAIESEKVAKLNERQAIEQRDHAFIAQSRFISARARDAANR